MSLAPTDNRPCFSEPAVAAVVRLALLNAELSPERYWQGRDPRRCWCWGKGGGGWWWGGGGGSGETIPIALCCQQQRLGRAQELCGSPGLSVLISLTVSMDVKQR